MDTSITVREIRAIYSIVSEYQHGEYRTSGRAYIIVRFCLKSYSCPYLKVKELYVAGEKTILDN